MIANNRKPVIVTVTINPAIDKLTTVNEVVPEKKLRCSQPVVDPGGGGINVARVINRLGGDACAIYLGGGYNGSLMKKLLDEEKVQSIQSLIANDTRENLVVLDISSNKQYRFGMPGPEVTEKECAALLNTIQTFAHIDFLVVSGSLSPGVPPSLLIQLGNIAKDKQAKYIVDTSGEALKTVLKAGVYLLKPNLDELASIAGTARLTPEGAANAARKIIENGQCEIVVISMGKDGAMLVSRDVEFRAAPPKVQVKSTVGAGDSMLGGIVWALSRQLDARSVLHYGVAAGTGATMNQGTELCHQQDVQMLHETLQGHVSPIKTN